jgi:hypothetical protein
MTRRERARWLVDRLGLTTLAGFLVAWLGGSRPRRAPGGPHAARGRPHLVPGRPYTALRGPYIEPWGPYIDPRGPYIAPRRRTRSPLYSRAAGGDPASPHASELRAALADGGHPRRPLRGALRWAARRTDTPP